MSFIRPTFLHTNPGTSCFPKWDSGNSGRRIPGICFSQTRMVLRRDVVGRGAPRSAAGFTVNLREVEVQIESKKKRLATTGKKNGDLVMRRSEAFTVAKERTNEPKDCKQKGKM
ncbi:hypothetical protein E2320_016930 [Naja naja]|nr:hypothetical protein E2320_016930 [Naja naja]